MNKLEWKKYNKNILSTEPKTKCDDLMDYTNDRQTELTNKLIQVVRSNDGKLKKSGSLLLVHLFAELASCEAMLIGVDELASAENADGKRRLKAIKHVEDGFYKTIANNNDTLTKFDFDN